MINRSKKSELRRIEAKRQRTEQRATLRRNKLAGVHPTVLLIWIAFFLATVFIMLSGGESLPYALNQTVTQDITARVPFKMVDQARIRQERQIAQASAPSVFTANPAPLEAVRGKLTEFLTLAKTTGDVDKIKALADERNLNLDLPAIRTLRTYAGTEQSKAYDAMVAKLVNRLSNEYIIGRTNQTVRPRPPRTCILQRGSQQIEVPTATLQFNTDLQNMHKRAQQLAAEVFPKPLQNAAATAMVRALTPPKDAEDTGEYAPWRYDAAATQKEIDAALARIPEWKTPYQAGDLLVKAGTPLGSNELAILSAEHDAYRKAEQTDPVLHRQNLQHKAGMIGLIFIATFGLAAYTLMYQGRVFQNRGRALGLAVLCLLMILLTRLNEHVQQPWDSPVEFSVACIVTTSVLLTIAYDQRFAFGIGGVLSILLTLASRSNIWLFLTLMAANGVAVFSLKEVRTRGKIIAVGALAGSAALLTNLFGQLYAGQDWRYVLTHSLAAFIGAVAAGFIVQGILHYFERIFGIATSLTLLEWCDASQPLLRKLAQEAPGTYSHSLILSQMADEAASAIGGNGLLARVGALYHDIGKTQKSPYFVENQEARMNRHDRLSPTMSLLIILGHVKDGIELARAYGLPRVLHQFIAEHHGTTIVKYFHHAASEKAAKDSRIKGRHDQVSESEFRYPGPKPRSKESAILMICDGCEGAVRALSEPTPGRVETLIHQIVMDRLNDGQFDDCDITLRELNLVEQSLVKSLCAIHHGRIKYPSKASEKPKCEEKPKDESAEPSTAPAGAEADSSVGSPEAREATPEVVQQR